MLKRVSTRRRVGGTCLIVLVAAACATWTAHRAKDHAVGRQIRSDLVSDLVAPDERWGATPEGCAKLAGGAQGITAVAVPLPGVPLVHVYSGKDIVSGLFEKELRWEQHEVEQLVWAMQQPVPIKTASGAISWGNASSLFVDVGANIGWFSLSLASHGYRVAAFEGMTTNQHLLHKSLCTADAAVKQRVQLFHVGLGASHATCWVYSGDNNVGDGHSNCDAPDEATAARSMPHGYSLRNKMPIRRLDAMLALAPGEAVKAIKVDVEGFELPVLEGAAGIFSKHTVYFMLIEFNLPPGKELDILRALHKLGFRFSFLKYMGPFVDGSSEEQLKALVSLRERLQGPYNLFCVNELLFTHKAEQFANVTTYASAHEILQHKWK